jgi:uncharacterized protein (DUF58 family)
VVGSVITLVAWAAIAHNSGAGWVQALGAILAGFLAVGLLLPGWATRRATVAVTASPLDATAGSPLELTVSLRRPVRLRPLDPPGPDVLSGRTRSCTLSVVARRGVLTSCTVEVASAAPFGLLWWTKRVELALPRPVLVAPRRGQPDPATLVVDRRASGEDLRRVDARVGEPRGVRSYQPGDLRHWVHWPATAHSGSLMVREMEQPASRPVTVEAVLPPDPEAADRLAERALGTVGQLLGSGRSVVLTTDEAGGRRSERVETLAVAGRRLARAQPPGGVPPGAAVLGSGAR